MKDGTGAEGRPLLRPLSLLLPLLLSPNLLLLLLRQAGVHAGLRVAARGGGGAAVGGLLRMGGGGRGSVRSGMWPRGRAVRGAAARRAARRGDAWGASTPMRRKTSRARQKNHARAGRVHRHLSPRETAGRGGARECGATHHGGGGAREVAWDERERGANGRSEGAGRKNNTPARRRRPPALLLSPIPRLCVGWVSATRPPPPSRHASYRSPPFPPPPGPSPPRDRGRPPHPRPSRRGRLHQRRPRAARGPAPCGGGDGGGALAAHVSRGQGERGRRKG